MAALTHRHLNLMKEEVNWSHPCRLRGQVEEAPMVPGLYMAPRARFHEEEFRVGDMVCRGSVWWWSVGTCFLLCGMPP